MNKKVRTKTVREWKNSDHKISCLTAYDYTFARILDNAGVDIILVGDSASNVIAGYDTTLPFTMENMIYHTAAVSRGISRALLVADLPFGSYQVSDEQAIKNAIRLMKSGHAEAVKLEGGEQISELVQKLTGSGIPVMGHLGLTPQSVHQFGGYHTQATSDKTASRLLHDAKILEEAGAFSLVLEKIPADLAAQVTESVGIPTIGIGAGNTCDGQVLVLYDMLGMYDDIRPKFVRRYAELGENINSAVKEYIQDIQNGSFPSEKESF